MANATKVPATTSRIATKVSRKLVTSLNEFAEVRSLYNLYKKLYEEGRSSILLEVGKLAQVLIHQGVDVAIIAKVEKQVLDQDLLKEKFPEAWEACQVVREEFHIRKATPKR